MNSNQPIGIFDSGVGGLTVAKAVKEILPNESIIYFGDTAHLPYGDKSVAAIQAYSVRIAAYLLNRGCKVILIACNSASSAAYDLVRAFVGKKAMVFDVIHPTIDDLRENGSGRKIGLIGTQQTVNSGVYAKKIKRLNRNINFVALATPLLVPMIEEGIFEEQISMDIIKKYLSDKSLDHINALILGCTHYPIIKKQIGSYFSGAGKEVEVIDAAEKVAKTLKSHLEHHLLHAKVKCKGDEFKVSDYTASFEKITRIFFGEEVNLERVSIGEVF
ncbi:MAG: glutamate racemase [Ekhidna sp.]|nr:glutamate racemase [Ekhidna sp.]